MSLQVIHLTIIGVIIIGVCLQNGAALNCYQCDSTVHGECTEIFDLENEHLQLTQADCPVHNSSYCIKTTGVWGAIVGTTRFCSSEDMYDQCQYVRYRDHDRVYRACVYTCTVDGCNSSSTIQIHAFVLTFMLLWGFFLCKR